ncbi:unnamed protein product [Chironomus riparius]|uniref:Uncharacterized protein n=1 Tax=Chironomus riparius TaxID=315576 RepID=A0A9N9RYX8_9DIPT|nr:unnamed protein product [Chironomus riparius]
MKFLILLIIINTAISSSSSYIYDDRLKSLQSQINDVKIKVDGLLKSCKNETNSTSDDGRYKGSVSTFLHNNGTDNLHQNETAANTSSTSNYLTEIKEKIQKFFHIKKDSKNKEVTKIKRCLSKTVGRNCEKVDMKLSNDEEVKQLLMKFFKCLSLHGGKVFNASDIIQADPPDLNNYDFASTTACPEKEEDENDTTRTQAYLRYLASSKHTVEEIGKPKFKKPDLKKTQEIIDNAKSSMWINFEVEEVSTTAPKTTTEEYENVPELPILKREAEKDTKKDKRNGLFKGIINSVSDFQYEVPNVALSLEQSTPDGREESIDEVNKLVQKISIQQQEDLMKFLDQLNEKPKEFKFNVDKYFMLAFENLTKSGNENLDESDNNTNVGAKKYFEFDSGAKKKRHTKDKRIQELSQHFVNQFKDHRDEKFVDYKKVVEHAYNHHVDNSFLDKSFRLNDGSSKTSELIKPMHIINNLKSPKEINMDIELGEQIKEIEDDFHPADSKRTDSEGAVDAPFYKTEGVLDMNEFDEFSP